MRCRLTIDWNCSQSSRSAGHLETERLPSSDWTDHQRSDSEGRTGSSQPPNSDWTGAPRWVSVSSEADWCPSWICLRDPYSQYILFFWRIKQGEIKKYRQQIQTFKLSLNSIVNAKDWRLGGNDSCTAPETGMSPIFEGRTSIYQLRILGLTRVPGFWPTPKWAKLQQTSKQMAKISTLAKHQSLPIDNNRVQISTCPQAMVMVLMLITGIQ